MKFQPTNIHPSRMSASARCVCLRAYLHVATVTEPAMATAIAKMITSATSHLLHPLPARLVDGGVESTGRISHCRCWGRQGEMSWERERPSIDDAVRADFPPQP